MQKMKLALAVSASFGLDPLEQIRLFHQVGFEGFATDIHEPLAECRRLADELNMDYHYIHAPFTNAAKMWKPDAEPAVQELLDCVSACAEVHVPILVVHVFIGFGSTEEPSACGIENFRRVVEFAREKGVSIAFENTEGEQYLAALMQAFASYENVGFCWDSGHELCYNGAKDMLALYGDRLLCTHLNDNLGVRDYAGQITWIDDLHLLPFDGITDWPLAMQRLQSCRFPGILSFELTCKSKPGRHDNDKYAAMPIEQYIAESYARACRLAFMLQKANK